MKFSIGISKSNINENFKFFEIYLSNLESNQSLDIFEKLKMFTVHGIEKPY